MAVFELDIKMPKSYEKLLFGIVDESMKKETLSFWVYGTENKYTINSTAGESWDETLPGDPFYSFDVLGLISIYRTQISTWNIPHYYFVITTKGFRWAEYHKKDHIRKWFFRHPNIIKNIMTGLILALTTLLTILQVAQLFNPKFMEALRLFLGITAY